MSYAEIILNVHENETPHIIKLRSRDKTVVYEEMRKLRTFFASKPTFDTMDFTNFERMKKYLKDHKIPYYTIQGNEFYRECDRVGIDPACFVNEELFSYCPEKADY
jgi:hypothetical protein